MATSYECKSCGNIISASDDRCPYCGTMKSYSSSNSSFFSSGNNNNQNKNNNFFNKETMDTVNRINWVIFIILLVIFWPAAIIYLIIKSQEKR